MTTRLSFFAPCPRGVESLLADELRRLGVHGARPQRAGVLFSGPLRDGYIACLWSRLASRVLLSLGDLDASSADALYAGVAAIAWEDHVRASGTIVVDATGVNDALRNTQFTAVKVKDAVADRFRERFGRRPSVDAGDPDLRINVVVGKDKARIAIDLSGDPLHRRGYRKPGEQVTAPMKETLAAALLEIAGWRDIAQSGGGFCDPLCGSGTLAIEAAMMAHDIAPGLLRPRWGFDRWLGHDADVWERLLDRADERCETGRAVAVPIACSDNDADAVRIARDCVSRAGLDGLVSVSQVPLSAAVPPQGAERGLIAVNPPYGERLSERSQLPALYAQLAQLARERFGRWALAVITPDERLSSGLSMRPATVHELYNGRILAPVSVFTPDAPRANAPAVPDVEPDAGAQAFRNRLAKMAKHVGTWARRSGVTCYRVYDADLPDYNVAIDLYTSDKDGARYAHLAEYAPPGDVDPAKATQRMRWAELAAAEVLDVDPANVFLKRRERQRGSSQYERHDAPKVTTMVRENGLLFEVNFSEYLDTGLFLDHRDTRAWVRDMAADTRFLNLFAYTGSATVYAAAGGAASTTTVDLSQTYLHWATRNLAANGHAGDRHLMLQADVMAWVAKAAEAGESYDLIFCDPPTFSNSKRMDRTWDVQRDHVELINAVSRLMAPGGTLVFSCNRRRFQMDTAALEMLGLIARDVTKRTIPKDFERHPDVHSCWIIVAGDDAAVSRDAKATP